ncbi:MAG: hypothetical protein NT141_00915 [candidate division WWE3 bacterium]|nr:hypothetical protein [candidate division WWE3 bacterium]
MNIQSNVNLVTKLEVVVGKTILIIVSLTSLVACYIGMAAVVKFVIDAVFPRELQPLAYFCAVVSVVALTVLLFGLLKSSQLGDEWAAQMFGEMCKKEKHVD